MRVSIAALAAVMLAAAPSPADAVIIRFLDNPSTNAADWTNHVTGMGLGINTNVNFNTAPLNSSAANYYSAPPVGLNITQFAPADHPLVVDYLSLAGGPRTCPCSTGEGPMPFSRMLYLPDETRMVFTFDAPVHAVGFYIGDKYDPNFQDVATLVAYSGPNATGTVLGSGVFPSRGLVRGNQIFAGLASDTANIRSVGYYDPRFNGEGTYLDNFRFSVPLAATATPGPATAALLAAGLLGLAARRRA